MLLISTSTCNCFSNVFTKLKKKVKNTVFDLEKPETHKMYAALSWLLVRFDHDRVKEEELKRCIEILYIVQMNSSAIFDYDG